MKHGKKRAISVKTPIPGIFASMPSTLPFRLPVRVQLPGGYGGMALYLDFSPPLAGSCVPIALIREEIAVAFPRKSHGAVAGLYVKDYF